MLSAESHSSIERQTSTWLVLVCSWVWNVYSMCVFLLGHSDVKVNPPHISRLWFPRALLCLYGRVDCIHPYLIPLKKSSPTEPCHSSHEQLKNSKFCVMAARRGFATIKADACYCPLFFFYTSHWFCCKITQPLFFLLYSQLTIIMVCPLQIWNL